MDPRQLRKLLEDHYFASYGWAVHCCRGDREEAAEVVQTAFLKVLEGRARFGGRSDFKTWIFGVIRNTAASLRRRLLRRLQGPASGAPVETANPEPVAETQLYQAQLARLLSGFVAQLSPRQRDLLHLVFYQEMTVDEAAATLGISVGSARVHYQRGKERLKRHLEESEANHESIWPRQDQRAV